MLRYFHVVVVMSTLVSLMNVGDGDLGRIDNRFLIFGILGLPVWWGLGYLF